jgi:hypothetical protein
MKLLVLVLVGIPILIVFYMLVGKFIKDFFSK